MGVDVNPQRLDDQPQQVDTDNAYVGRTYRDAPDIDGYIFINTDETLMTGDIVKVKVTGAYEYDLIGEICD